MNQVRSMLLAGGEASVDSDLQHFSSFMRSASMPFGFDQSGLAVIDVAGDADDDGFHVR
ncbi:MAG TPA: hypothetical protein VGJ33_20675 [Candidatus Angelobacter sp.]